MNNYHKQIETAIRATVIHSPVNYSWFGKLSAQLPAAVKRTLTLQSLRNYILFILQYQLYSDFYCQGGAAAPSSQQAVGSPAVGMTPFVERLSAANSGSGYWEDGWEVRMVENNKVFVSKGNLKLWGAPEDYLTPQNSLIKPTIELSLRFPKEFLNLSPGFYMASSNRQFSESDSQNLVRVYWNLTAEGAVPFMQRVTLMLNQVNVPFKLKVLNDPSHYTRCDAGVLYIRQNDYDSIYKILEKIYPEIAANLKQGTPAFSKPLADGIGLAEDPGQGNSFGLNRCRVLAEGLLRAYDEGKKSVDERLQVVEDRFRENGISLEKPFLNPGSRDDYKFQPQCGKGSQFSYNTVKTLYIESPAETFLQTAYRIGQRLSQEAIWHKDRCNWLGIEPMVDSRADAPAKMTYKALGPDLYSGTSGVALFLSQLYSATGDAAIRRTAIGAIQQAISCVDTLPPSSPLGLYTGYIGIAFAAANVATILGEDKLLKQAMQLLQRSVAENRDECEFDIISGRAGAIAALMVLQGLLDDASLQNLAVELGKELLQTVDVTKAGYSWKSSDFPTHRNLTGFSHGTAGVAYALLELFHATGDSEYRQAAEQAFNYERYWFDAQANNWPDFREASGRGKRSRSPLPFNTFWCHGAPGIALSRLRAYEILKHETCKSEAITGLQTTYNLVKTWLNSGTGNYSLCHGRTGNAEVLFYGYQVLGKEYTNELKIVHAIANTGIEIYAKRGNSWPCGTGGGETPGFMLGLAGIGYFYLRLYDPQIPSILILQPERFVRKKPTM